MQGERQHGKYVVVFSATCDMIREGCCTMQALSIRSPPTKASRVGKPHHAEKSRSPLVRYLRRAGEHREAYVQIVYPVRTAFLATHDLSTVTRTKILRAHHFRSRTTGSTSPVFSTPPTSCPSTPSPDRRGRGRYPFDIYTCGGIKVWVDGNQRSPSPPYRTFPGPHVSELDLAKGVHQIEVYADDLAERDVFFYLNSATSGKHRSKESAERTGSSGDSGKGTVSCEAVPSNRGHEEGKVELVSTAPS
jgi:hypothetical protein